MSNKLLKRTFMSNIGKKVRITSYNVEEEVIYIGKIGEIIGDSLTTLCFKVRMGDGRILLPYKPTLNHTPQCEFVEEEKETTNSPHTGELKPFNLERALAGDPVITKNKCEVSEIFYFKTLNGLHKVRAIIDGEEWKYTEEGRVYDSEFSDMDLFMAPITTVYYRNLYSRAVHDVNFYNSIEQAKDLRREFAIAVLEFTEQDGKIIDIKKVHIY